MPRIGGPSLAQSLRERLTNLSVAFMPGHTGETAVERGAEGPGTAVLQKPFLLADLARAVEKALGQQVRRAMRASVSCTSATSRFTEAS